MLKIELLIDGDFELSELKKAIKSLSDKFEGIRISKVLYPLIKERKIAAFNPKIGQKMSVHQIVNNGTLEMIGHCIKKVITPSKTSYSFKMLMCGKDFDGNSTPSRETILTFSTDLEDDFWNSDYDVLNEFIEFKRPEIIPTDKELVALSVADVYMASTVTAIEEELSPLGIVRTVTTSRAGFYQTVISEITS